MSASKALGTGRRSLAVPHGRLRGGAPGRTENVRPGRGVASPAGGAAGPGAPEACARHCRLHSRQEELAAVENPTLSNGGRDLRR